MKIRVDVKRISFLRRYFIIIFCFILLSLPSKYTSPIRRAVLNFFKIPLKISMNIANFFIHYSDYKGIIAKNKLLQQKNMELSLENSHLRYLKEENDRLRAILDCKKKLSYLSLVAEVIGLDYAENRKVIFLDRGSRDNVSEQMVCLNSDGLVGKITEVGKNISKAICLNDPNSRIPAKIENTREQGLVYGTIKGDYLEMRYLSKETRAKSGDRVITSGLGSIYPKGISIGTISEIKVAGFYKTAIIRPAVDFLRLEEILLIRRPEE